MGAWPASRLTTWSMAVLVVWSAILSSALGQISFEKMYGGHLRDVAHSVQQTRDGGYVMTGETSSWGAGDCDVYLTRMDSLGCILWSRTFGGSSYECGNSVQQTSDNGYVIAGQTRSFGPGLDDILLIKTDSVGATIWERVIGGSDSDVGNAVCEIPGGYIVVGYTLSYGAGGGDAYLIRTDYYGNAMWSRTFGDSSFDAGNSIDRTSDGGYIIGGYSWSFGSGSFDGYLVKTDSLGELIWQRTCGGVDRDELWSVREVKDGGYAAAGRSRTPVYDVYFVRTDATGRLLWAERYGGPGDDWCNSMEQTSDGGYILAGCTYESGSKRSSVYLVKTNWRGKALWTTTLGRGVDDDVYETGCIYRAVGGEVHSVQETSDGGYIVAGAGWTEYSDLPDAYVIKTKLVPLHDCRVVSLDLPESEVFPTDTVAVMASVLNCGHYPESFDVAVSIGDYVDTARVLNLEPRLEVHVVFDDWVVSPEDSVTYAMSVCAYVAGDVFPEDNCIEKSIWATMGPGPVILSAWASDNRIGMWGIDNDDYVRFVFDKPCNAPAIDEANIDKVLSLSGGHSWLDGSGEIGCTFWNVEKTRLLVMLSTAGGFPIVAVGDTVTPDGETIQDSLRRPVKKPAIIYGSFDPFIMVSDASREAMPGISALHQNHPNPIHQSTVVSFSLSAASKVTLSIYDISGRLVETLVNETQQPGIHQVLWDRKANPGGVYFYRLKACPEEGSELGGGRSDEPVEPQIRRAGEFVETRKMVLVD